MEKKKVVFIGVLIANISFYVLLIHAIINVIILKNTNPEYFYGLKRGYTSAVITFIFYNDYAFNNPNVFNQIFYYIMCLVGLFTGIFYYYNFDRVKGGHIIGVRPKAYYDSKNNLVKSKEDFLYERMGLITIALVVFYVSAICLIGIPWWFSLQNIIKKNKFLNRKTVWSLRLALIIFVFAFIVVGGFYTAFTFKYYGHF
ncbi:MAG: hypothetical protein J6Q38_03855 [Clostridia bacterium]|nr:hypothetical protein [Clostridia bacterium]